MKKFELIALAEKLHMEPLMVATDVRECYGEEVVVSGYQTGFQLSSEKLVPELDEIAEDVWGDHGFLPVVADRMRTAEGGYLYHLFAPSNWFEEV